LRTWTMDKCLRYIESAVMGKKYKKKFCLFLEHIFWLHITFGGKIIAFNELLKARERRGTKKNKSDITCNHGLQIKNFLRFKL